jgi:hypothetical protein
VPGRRLGRGPPPAPGGGPIRRPAKAALREIRDFYTLGADCLWITVADGYLWWAFAGPEMVWRGPSTAARGARLRRTLGPWRNTDRQGRPLKIDELSPRLTQVGADRRTICAVAAADDLVRRINGREAPTLARTRAARAATIAAAEAMIATCAGRISRPWSPSSSPRAAGGSSRAGAARSKTPTACSRISPQARPRLCR